MLLSVGDAADCAVRGTFVNVLVRYFFLLPLPSALRQCPTEAASETAGGRRREGMGADFWRRQDGKGKYLLIALTEGF